MSEAETQTTSTDGGAGTIGESGGTDPTDAVQTLIDQGGGDAAPQGEAGTAVGGIGGAGVLAHRPRNFMGRGVTFRDQSGHDHPALVTSGPYDDAQTCNLTVFFDDAAPASVGRFPRIDDESEGAVGWF